MKIIAFDTEVFFSSKLKYSLKTMVAEQFVKHELFDCYMLAVSDGSTTWAGHPKNFNWSALDGATLLSHNARWDETCYLEMVERGLAPKLNIPAWFCTADLTSYLCNRRALDHASEHLLGIKVSKAARNDSNGKHWPADFSEAEQKVMLEYCRKDAHICWTLWDKFSSKWPENERRLSLMTRLQGRRGVQINTELLDQYIIQSHSMKLATEKLLPWLSDTEEESWEEFPDKPTSTKAIAEACRRAGIPSPPVKSHFEDGEELYANWELAHKARNPWISALSSWRTVNRLYKTFLTAKSRLRSDGTLPFGLKYFGAHTGRWSGDSGLNFQNLKKRPVYCTREGLMETDETREPGDWVKYELDFRKLIIPRKDTVMIVSDLSQVEPRCLAWLCGDKAFLKLVASGQSPYEAAARTTLGWTGGDLKKENPLLYAESKARCIGEGTLIRTRTGYVPIEKIKETDKLWDGENWVKHGGVVNNGQRKIIWVGNECFTDDHKIFIRGNPVKAGDVPPGMCREELERQFSPDSEWLDICRLGSAVAVACSSFWLLACVLSLSKVWKKSVRSIQQFGTRVFKTLCGVFSPEKLGNSESRDLGIQTWKDRTNLGGTMESDNAAML